MCNKHIYIEMQKFKQIAYFICQLCYSQNIVKLVKTIMSLHFLNVNSRNQLIFILRSQNFVFIFL